jgi:outer membrane immunogenic protein
MSARVRLLCSVALPIFFAAPVMAADLPVKAPLIASSSPAPAVHDWSGFYAGVNAGANWARSGDPSTAAQCTGASGFALGSYFACADTPAINSVGTGSISGRGFTGGVQAGYNWQFHSLVVGVEADYDAFQVKASRTGVGNYASIPNQFSVTSSIEATALLTARARLGWAFGNFLAYATGGSAATHLRATNSFTDDTTPGFNGGGAGGWNASAKKLGWTVVAAPNTR